ncbi:MAG: DUF4145 domain-containing protein [Oceanospirillaceae bacterium]|nr:DUF4145 domain-containing protein [Oceanospirillaceae bacterium]
MKSKIPTFKGKSFNCPNCGAFSHMDWQKLHIGNTFNISLYWESRCSCCNKSSLWRVTVYRTMPVVAGIEKNKNARIDQSAELLYPDIGSTPLPANDMPDDVKDDYIEAANIFSNSPRGSAALLRLALQKLCVHLGEKGKDINTDIRSLAKKETIPPSLIRVADTVRLTGNNAVHPGKMSDEDRDYVASKMFSLINLIVVKGITEPKEIEELYEMTPEGPRKAAEERDAESKISK